MIKLNFTTIEELKNYLITENYSDAKFYIEPDFVKAIFGISNNGRLLYYYSHMVEDLYLTYLETDGIKHPLESAIEYIDINITHFGNGSPIVVYELPIEGYSYLFECEGLDDFLCKYTTVVIGIDELNNILIDDNIPNNDKDEINSFVSKYPNINILYV